MASAGFRCLARLAVTAHIPPAAGGRLAELLADPAATPDLGALRLHNVGDSPLPAHTADALRARFGPECGDF